MVGVEYCLVSLEKEKMKGEFFKCVLRNIEKKIIIVGSEEGGIVNVVVNNVYNSEDWVVIGESNVVSMSFLIFGIVEVMILLKLIKEN